MFTSERDAAPCIRRLIEREERIGIKRTLLELCSETKDLARLKPFVSLKTRYSDFVVREVSLRFNDGEPLRLDSLPSRSPTKDSREQKSAKRLRHELVPNKEVLRVVTETFTPLISEVDLNRLLAGLQEGERSILLTDTPADKAHRTAIHQAVKATLGDTHVSTTQKGSVAILRATKEERHEESRRSKPLKTRPFLHFTLYKENIDSMHALRTMAKYLHLSTRQFQYCGTKDKRAVTLQRVAIRDIVPAKILAVNRLSFGPRCVVKVSNFTEETTGLKLGDAYGNYFQILLRSHPCSPKISNAQLAIVKATLGKKGVINYFGPQRFGTTEVLTSDVGLMLLRGQYREAIEAIFESKAFIDPQIKEILPLIREKDYAGALKKIPFYNLQECDILRHLIKHPNDYIGTLNVIPRTLGMLYFHAAQSLIWNRMVSQRLSDETRTCPEVGDLVLASVYKARMTPGTEAMHAEERLRGESNPDGLELSDEKLPAVQMLSEQDDLSRFDLSDILLPIPGPDVELRYPESLGCSKNDYRVEMEALGVDTAFLDHINSNPLVKIFHYHGTYRAICIRPQRLNLSCTVVSDWLQRVALTDWEQLRVKHRFDQEKKATDMTDAPLEQEPVHSPDGDEAVPNSRPEYQVIMADFFLPSGSYATTLLREFCIASSEGFHEEAAHVSDASD